MAILRYVVAILISLSLHARAETIPAAQKFTYQAAQYRVNSSGSCHPNHTGPYPSISSACNYWWSISKANCPTNTQMQQASVTVNGLVCIADVWSTNTQVECPSGYSYDSTTASCKSDARVWTCPTTGGWTLNGQNCERTVQCNSGDSVSGGFFAGWSVGKDKVVGPSGGAYTFPVSQCQNGCSVNVASSSLSCTGKDGSVDSPQPITCTGTATKTGDTCTSETTAEPDTKPVIPNHPPKCAADEGVLTSSSGKVACVPQGTPSSVPVVKKETKTDTFPDGSKKTTETTVTKDPLTGAEDSQQTTVTTGKASGGAGTAGPVGTSTSNSGSGSTQGGSPVSSGSGTGEGSSSDLCKNNPGLQICKGGMNEEITQKAIKDILSPTDQPNMSALDAVKQENKQKEDAHKQLFEDWGAKGQSDTNGWFAWAMIPEVPSGSCAPMTGQFMGRTIQFDWCDELEKVRAIAGYAFYILTAFALFSIFTGAFGRKS